MKLTINQIKGVEPQVSVTYDEMTPEVERVIDLLKGNHLRLTGKSGDETVVISAATILYIDYHHVFLLGTQYIMSIILYKNGKM